jgi:hypothetical protein
MNSHVSINRYDLEINSRRRVSFNLILIYLSANLTAQIRITEWPWVTKKSDKLYTNSKTHNDDDNNNNSIKFNYLLFMCRVNSFKATYSVDTSNYIMDKHNIKSETNYRQGLEKNTLMQKSKQINKGRWR